jgi:hypothetical protein
MYTHIILSARDRLALFPSPAARLRAARTIARVGGAENVLFCASDDHVHGLVSTQAPSRLAAALSLALRRFAAAPLAPAHLVEVASRQHLARLVPYILDQTSHHALETASHPALWPGSSFADLVGARVLPGFDSGVLREALPRLSAVELFAAVGLRPVAPVGDERLADLGLTTLTTRVAELVGRDSLRMRREDRARALVVALACRFDVPKRRVAAVLGITTRHVRRLAALPTDPNLESALRRWVAIHDAALAPGATMLPPRRALSTGQAAAHT